MKMYFKLLPKTGSHSESGPSGKVVTYIASDGKVIESENDLVKMFPEKFEKVNVSGAPELPTVEQKAPVLPLASLQETASKKAKGAKVSKEVLAESKLGRDVTKRFPHADEEDFKVFSTGGEFFVVEVDEPDIALNPQPLKRGQVEAFVDKYLKG